MNIYYACKYTPVEVIEACGQTPLPLTFETASFETAEAKTSPNICGYAKSLIEFALSGSVQALILTTCCDAMRRTFDVLKHEAEKSDTTLEFVYLLDLPHDSSDVSARRYAKELGKFQNALQSYLQKNHQDTSLTHNLDKQEPTQPYAPVPATKEKNERHPKNTPNRSEEYEKNTISRSKEELFDEKKLLLSWEKASERFVQNCSFRKDIPNTIAHENTCFKDNLSRNDSSKDSSQQETILLIGAHATPSLLQLGTHVFGDALENLTCSGRRQLSPPPRDVLRESPRRPCEHLCSQSSENLSAQSPSQPSSTSSTNTSLQSSSPSSKESWGQPPKQPPIDDEYAKDPDPLLFAYSKALLKQTPCYRMVNVKGREDYLRDHIANSNAAGCLFHTMKFCDFYGFEHAHHAKKLDMPLLKIETEGTPQSAGQIKTRLEAFAESIKLKTDSYPGRTTDAHPKEGRMAFSHKSESEREALHSTFASHTCAAKPSPAKGATENSFASGSNETSHSDSIPSNAALYVMGLDSGSTSTDAVIIDGTGTIVASAIVPTGANALKSAQAVYEVVLKKAQLSPTDIAYCVGTGYGRDTLPHTNCAITEITCHAKGAHALVPQTRTIIDIGGQDSKAIQIDKDGHVETFAMNDKCAAGTGRFIEALARTMELGLEEFAEAALAWKPGVSTDVVISSMCTVFAESEVISLVADSVDTVDIIHGLNKSVAQKTASLTKRVKATGPYLMTGGVAQNIGVLRALEEVLGESIATTPEAQIAGAYGAALLGLERLAKQT